MSFLRTNLLNSNVVLVFLLVALVFGVYAPAFNGAIVSIDDVHILSAYDGENTSRTVKEILAPGRSYYYRPLIELSYFLDYHIWDQTPSILHAENIALHALNSVLLFFVINFLFVDKKMAMAASALFAVHPVNSEAICWIAGRTDPLALTFILAGLISILKGVRSEGSQYYYWALLWGMCALLAKETAVMFLPVVCLMLWCFQAPRKIQYLSWFVCSVVFAVISTIVLSWLLTQQSAFNEILQGTDMFFIRQLYNGLSLFGFYIKKVLLPLPLNFAITKVSEGYALFAGLFAIALIVLKVRTCWYYFLVAGMLFLLPSVVAGVFEVAWTVVAERYLYIPMAFFAIGVVGVVSENERMRVRPHLVYGILWFIIAISAVLTFQRSQVWQSNLTLFQDTVNKTPDFALLRNELAVALMKAGQTDEAVKQLEIASNMQMSPVVRQLVRKNQLLFSLQSKSPQEARKIILSSVSQHLSEADTEVLSLLRGLDYEIITMQHEQELVGEIVMVTDILFERTKDPLMLYNNGQLMLKYGSKKTALHYFKRTAEVAPDHSPYKELAKKLVGSIKDTQ